MKKYSDAENWGIYYTPQTKEEQETAKAEAEAVKKTVESFILENLNNLKLTYISEEGENTASLMELETAVNQARTPELQKFLVKKCIPFEDGTIIVSVKQLRKRKKIEKKIFTLCEGRHKMPEEVEGVIFANSINPLDVNEMEKIASDKLEGIQFLKLYVTGLSVALVAVVNVCHQKNIKLVLMHFDRETEDYYPQWVK